MKVNPNANAVMEFNGKKVRTYAYLFSSDIIPDVTTNAGGHGPLYTGMQGYVKKFTFMLPLIVTEFCEPSLIKVTEHANDSGFTAGKGIIASAAIQSQAGDRVKTIRKMDLTDPYDSKYCLAKFNKFVLRSAQLSDQTAALFKFTDPGTALQNPTIELIAEANQLVSTPTCKLSSTMNGGVY